MLTWGSVSSHDLHNTYYPTLDLFKDSYFLTAFALALLLLLSSCIGLIVISLPSSISSVLYYYIVGGAQGLGECALVSSIAYYLQSLTYGWFDSFYSKFIGLNSSKIQMSEKN